MVWCGRDANNNNKSKSIVVMSHEFISIQCLDDEATTHCGYSTIIALDGYLYEQHIVVTAVVEQQQEAVVGW
jgi:hypothetical protein